MKEDVSNGLCNGMFNPGTRNVINSNFSNINCDYKYGSFRESHSELSVPVNPDANYTINNNSSDENEDYKYRQIKKNHTEFPETKLYRRRYLMLFLYCLCTMLNGFQWIQYPIIASIISCYYNISIITINWTSVVFNIAFLPLMFPVAWLMSAKGLRLTLIIGAAGNTISSCVQCLSLSPHHFNVVILSQTLAAISQTFIISVPSYLAALWFGADEVSLACAIGVFGNQLGIAFGFLIPPVLIPNDCSDKDKIHNGLSNMALGLTVLNFITFLLIVFAFEDKPPKPPSLAEANKPPGKPTFSSVCNILKNINFNLLLITYGIICSVYFSISSMLNQMVVRTFPGEEIDAGWMGAITVFAGLIGSVVCGYILDRTHKFRQTSFIVYFLSLVCMIAYTALMKVHYLWIQFVLFAFIGFFMTGYLPVGFEFGSEISYPEPEGTSTTLLNASVQITGIIITMTASWLQQTYSDLASNVFFCCCLLLGFFITIFIKFNSKRRKQYETPKLMEVPVDCK